ncbi:MAG: hypothetical protein ACRCV9_07965 [Burkholderiaceae bacterium]
MRRASGTPIAVSAGGDGVGLGATVGAGEEVAPGLGAAVGAGDGELVGEPVGAALGAGVGIGGNGVVPSGF